MIDQIAKGVKAGGTTNQVLSDGQTVSFLLLPANNLESGPSCFAGFPVQTSDIPFPFFFFIFLLHWLIVEYELNYLYRSVYHCYIN
jgi:hypothetical protein